MGKDNCLERNGNWMDSRLLMSHNGIQKTVEQNHQSNEKKNQCQPGILCPEKLSFNNKEKDILD